jgi:hypothetical protein
MRRSRFTDEQIIDVLRLVEFRERTEQTGVPPNRAPLLAKSITRMQFRVAPSDALVMISALLSPIRL